MIKHVFGLAFLVVLGACGTSEQDIEEIKKRLFVGVENGRTIYAITTETGINQSNIDKKVAKFQRQPYIIATVCPNGSRIEGVEKSEAYSRLIPGTTVRGHYYSVQIKFSCL